MIHYLCLFSACLGLHSIVTSGVSYTTGGTWENLRDFLLGFVLVAIAYSTWAL